MAQPDEIEAVLRDLDRLEEEVLQNEDRLWQGYSDLLRACHTTPAIQIADVVARHLTEGQDPNAASPFGETPLRSCFERSYWDAVELLVKAGADLSTLGLTPELEILLRGGWPDKLDPYARDAHGRTPFLFACRTGNLAAAQRLLPITPPEALLSDPGQEGPVLMAAKSNVQEMVQWLLDQDFDINHPSRYGATALLEAVQWDQVDMARFLLQAGAALNVVENLSLALREAEATAPENRVDLRAKLLDSADGMDTLTRPADAASSAEMVRVLVSFGADRAAFDGDLADVALGTDRLSPETVTQSDFADARAPRAGSANPQPYLPAFWRDQIRTCQSGYHAATALFGTYDDAPGDGPVWSFQRFGRSITELPDGRLVLIGGEHEDEYDPDFCIYSDVTVLGPEGMVDHYIYPEEVFPPTDFHTATLTEDRIILIGALGYPEARRIGETQVLALALEDFSITQVPCTGAQPGWIHGHTAELSGRHIVVSGGHIEPGRRDNAKRHTLDLATWRWTQVS